MSTLRFVGYGLIALSAMAFSFSASAQAQCYYPDFGRHYYSPGFHDRYWDDQYDRAYDPQPYDLGAHSYDPYASDFEPNVDEFEIYGDPYRYDHDRYGFSEFELDRSALERQSRDLPRFIPRGNTPFYRQREYDSSYPELSPSMDGGRCADGRCEFHSRQSAEPADSRPRLGPPDASKARGTDNSNALQPPDEEARDLPPGLLKLSPADRAAALRQRTCPVTGDVLGENGTPLKVTVGGRDIYVCCQDCVEEVQQNPGKYVQPSAGKSHNHSDHHH